MKLFPSILVPLDGSRTAARSLGAAVWLAERLDAQMHILSATVRALPARDELTRLNVPEAYWPRITLHQAPEYPEDAILAAIPRFNVKLLVMTARGGGTALAETERDPAAIVGHVTRAMMERSPVPVLLLPPAYRELLPWERVLVPISGNVEGNEAVLFAVRLANALDLKVHIAHVSVHGEETGIAARARYADAVHYEYPGQLHELVQRSLPQCTPEECYCIEGVALVQGDVETELRALIAKKRISLLVIGWRGRFMAGHAYVLKRLVQTITCPLLMLKSGAEPPFRLRVGDEFE